MAINTNTGFKVGASVPIDSRLVLKKSEMVNVDDNTMPSVYMCMCSTDGEFYTYNKNYEKLESIGRFRKLNADGSIDISSADYKAIQESGTWEENITYYVS